MSSPQLVAFFYLLARDGMPWGTINNLIDEATKGAGQDIVFRSLAAELLAREQVEWLCGERETTSKERDDGIPY